jgi:multidrug efflux system outer membrane protein
MKSKLTNFFNVKSTFGYFQGSLVGAGSRGRYLLLLLLLLCTCMVGPNYKRPTVPIPKTWRFQEKETKEVTNTKWWEQFGDTVLNQLLEEALRENYDIQIASSRIEEYRGRLTTTRSAIFPQLSAEVGGGITNSARSGDAVVQVSGGKGTPYYQADLSVSWQIDLWGKLRRANEAARATLMSTEDVKRGVILSLVSSVANGYINLLVFDKQLLIAHETANTLGYNYRLFQLQYEQGLISDLELNQARSEYEQAQASIPVISIQIATQENMLSYLLGHNPSGIPRGKTIDNLNFPPVPAGLPASLLENRPDIIQAEADLIAANAQIGAARAQYFPSISLTGLLGLVSTDFTKFFTDPSTVWSAAVPLVAPIFNAGAISGQVKSAKASQQQALARYKQTIQGAFRDVEDALINQEKTREQLNSVKMQVEALENTVCFARLRFNTGYVSYIDVLTAETSLFQTSLSLVQTQGHLLQSLVNLYAAMGGGWEIRS